MCPVLIVDDDEDNLRLFRRICERQGVEAKFASTGDDALAILDGGPVAVMITDLRMPQMNGIELAQRAKAIRPDIAVVVMTGYLSPEVQVLAEAAGIVEVVAKPLTALKFLSAIKDAAAF